MRNPKDALNKRAADYDKGVMANILHLWIFLTEFIINHCKKNVKRDLFMIYDVRYKIYRPFNDFLKLNFWLNTLWP